MHRDSFGRPWIMGDEQTPADLICFRCGEVPYTQGNPWGACIFEQARAADSPKTAAFALCDTCSIAMHEFLNPEMAATPRYQAAKDQHYARMDDQIRDWNNHVLNTMLMAQEGVHIPVPDMTREVPDEPPSKH